MIETEVLLLRRVEVDDVEAVGAQASNPEQASRYAGVVTVIDVAHKRSLTGGG